MIAWFIARDDRLLGPHGWVREPQHAMRFQGESEARFAIEAMHRETPALVRGDVRPVSREWSDNPFAPAVGVAHEYDPFGLHRERAAPRVTG